MIFSRKSSRESWEFVHGNLKIEFFHESIFCRHTQESKKSSGLGFKPIPLRKPSMSLKLTMMQPQMNGFCGDKLENAFLVQSFTRKLLSPAFSSSESKCLPHFQCRYLHINSEVSGFSVFKLNTYLSYAGVIISFPGGTHAKPINEPLCSRYRYYE